MAVSLLILHVGVEDLRVLGAELEDVADLDALPHLELASADRAWLTTGHLTQVRPLAHRDVAGDVDPAIVPVVLVGPRGHVHPALQGEVGDHPMVAHTDRTETPRVGAKHLSDHLRLGRAPLRTGRGIEELLLLETMIAAEQDDDGLPVDDVDQRLDLPGRRRHLGMGFGKGLDRPQTRGGEPLHIATGTVIDLVEPRRRSLDVRPIVTIGAGHDPVLTGVAPLHELDRLGAAHRP